MTSCNVKNNFLTQKMYNGYCNFFQLVKIVRLFVQFNPLRPRNVIIELKNKCLKCTKIVRIFAICFNKVRTSNQVYSIYLVERGKKRYKFENEIGTGNS